MAVDTSVIGKPTGAWKVTVERGPSERFAAAVTDENPVYSSLEAAKAAGFDNVPVPPTYSFAQGYWGSFSEQQPPDPTGGQNPMHSLMGALFAKGGLVLHGEQEFTYHRPIQVGDVLDGAGVVTNLYEKDTEKAVMTFIVIETTWKDAKTGDPVVTETFNLIHRLNK
ncbi:MAG: hypothetical protein JWL73_779 [Actinomycetia bacterium]|nr:hypothetical protein [Actinomycetes bacterium]